MGAGFAHIAKLGITEDSHGRRVAQYQFVFNEGSDSYGRTFDEPGLLEFLSEELGIRAEVIERAVGDLHTLGRTNIPDLHIVDSETAALGLEEVPSDY